MSVSFIFLNEITLSDIDIDNIGSLVLSDECKINLYETLGNKTLDRRFVDSFRIFGDNIGCLEPLLPF